MKLTAAINQNDRASLEMVKSLLDNPAIISLEVPQFGVSLEVETYQKIGSADVSQRPVIVPGIGVKQYLNDNVAPQPIQWQLSGYIPGNQLLELTNNYTPIVMANTEMLWIAFEKGARIVYKDMDQRVYNNCVISALTTGNKADVKNKMPFTMTIQEIKTIEASIAELTEAQQKALPEGEDSDMGTTGTTVKNVSDAAELIGLNK